MSVNFIPKISKMLNTEYEKIQILLKDETILKIREEFNLSKNDDENIDFNIFEIISNLYYRENLHSDIIANLLDPKGKHNEKNKFLILFINLISQISDKTFNINDYFNSEIITEYGIKGKNHGRIDILIKAKASKKAIIIENKINNAGDTYKQLYKYFKAIEEEGIKVEAEKILQSINYTDEFFWQGTRFYKYFNFPKEEEIMYEFIDNFLKQLNKWHS